MRDGGGPTGPPSGRESLSTSNRGRVSSAFGPSLGSGAEHPSRRSGSSAPGTGLYGRIGGHYQEQKPVESAILVPAVRVGGARGRGAPEGKGVARWPASATSAFGSGRIDPVGTRPTGTAPQLRFGIAAPDRRGKFRVATVGTVQIRDQVVTVRLSLPRKPLPARRLRLASILGLRPAVVASSEPPTGRLLPVPPGGGLCRSPPLIWTLPYGPTGIFVRLTTDSMRQQY